MSLPFGDGQSTSGSCGDPSPMHMMGKERDPESNLDDFGARFYSSTFGRWMSPDWSDAPEPVPYANLSNPQTLNLYGMVRDNPETFADLDGHEPSLLQAQGGTDSKDFVKAATSPTGNPVTTSPQGGAAPQQPPPPPKNTPQKGHNQTPTAERIKLAEKAALNTAIGAVRVIGAAASAAAIPETGACLQREQHISQFQLQVILPRLARN